MSEPYTPITPTSATEHSEDPVREPDPEHAHETTTTHAGYGEGNPRLVLSHDGWAYEGEEQTQFSLDGEVVVIGSGPDADIVLDGLAPAHAEIRHDDRDEYVLVLLGSGGAPTQSSGPDVDRPGPQALHTGASFHVGDWTLTFMRDEYADHGRPFGGRKGGEGEVQPPQNPRPDYREDHEEARDQA